MRIRVRYMYLSAAAAVVLLVFSLSFGDDAPTKLSQDAKWC